MSTRTHDENVHRVAALALGLAFAGRGPEMAVEELLHAAAGRVELLTAATARVSASAVGDHDTNRRAADLLRQAVARRRRAEVSQPRPVAR